MRRSFTLVEAIVALKEEKEKKRAKGLEDFERNTKKRRLKRPPPDIKSPITIIY